MSLTLLEIAQECAQEIGIKTPATVVGNSNQQVSQLLALINRTGRMVAREYNWRRQEIEYVFETTPATSLTGDVSAGGVISSLSSTSALSVGMLVTGEGLQTWAEIASIDSATQVTLNLSATAGSSVSLTFAIQEYALPSGFDRMVGSTQWDRTNFWPNAGPKSAQEWAWLKGGVISTGPRYRYRIYGNNMRFTPAPTAATTLSYEYISKSWVIPTAGSVPTKEKFNLDSDTCIFNDDLIVLGSKYQWYKTKGLDFSLALAEYGRALSTSKAQDTPSPVLSLSPEPASILISPYNVPESGYNL